MLLRGCSEKRLDEIGSPGGAKRRQTRIGILFGQIGIGRKGVGRFSCSLALPERGVIGTQKRLRSNLALSRRAQPFETPE